MPPQRCSVAIRSGLSRIQYPLARRAARGTIANSYRGFIISGAKKCRAQLRWRFLAGDGLVSETCLQIPFNVTDAVPYPICGRSLRKQYRTFPRAFVAQDDVDQMQRAKPGEQAEERDVGIAQEQDVGHNNGHDGKSEPAHVQIG